MEGKRVKVEEVEAWREQSETREHLVVRVKAKVFDGNSEAAVEKDAKFYKASRNMIKGYVNIHAGAEGGRKADYARTAAVLKALGVDKWSRKGKTDTTHRRRPRCADEAEARVQSVGSVLLNNIPAPLNF
ncbi:hypothetical protein [Pyrobaculum ferrireducens]|uniref:Uncharacterized protein n=1 Tax=Pyrobaculum ferrireducens TaxID=1104324 RepID=G7VC84_9CREN|nr:hypothetical protein [Pyrobaculum ferrireducens]AET33770.1 hypothetical protein P186_2384 [Pyrobaculum ferrireducens]